MLSVRGKIDRGKAGGKDKRGGSHVYAAKDTPRSSGRGRRMISKAVSHGSSSWCCFGEWGLIGIGAERGGHG